MFRSRLQDLQVLLAAPTDSSICSTGITLYTVTLQNTWVPSRSNHPHNELLYHYAHTATVLFHEISKYLVTMVPGAGTVQQQLSDHTNATAGTTSDTDCHSIGITVQGTQILEYSGPL
jgi:hypothetical protein